MPRYVRCRWDVIGEIGANVFDQKLMKLPQKNFRVGGYLQAYKYFVSFQDEVKREFIFQDSIRNEADNILHSFHDKYRGSLFVGVHVRRGDFLRPDNLQLGYSSPEKSYFVKAFDTIKSKFLNINITFLVASDDVGWCNANLVADDVIALPPASGAVHLAILSKCDHVIMSGGTFGWWGAWLSGGYVIYFTGFMVKGTPFGNIFSYEDYYPPHWVGLGN